MERERWCHLVCFTYIHICTFNLTFLTLNYENHDIAIAMSSSRADPILGLNILRGGLEGFKSMPQPWLEVFKCLIQSHCTGWGYLNVYISITALTGGI